METTYARPYFSLHVRVREFSAPAHTAPRVRAVRGCAGGQLGAGVGGNAAGGERTGDAPDMEGDGKVVDELGGEEELGLLLVRAAEGDAVHLAVHDAVRKCLGGEHDDVCLLAAHREGAERRAVSLERLTALLVDGVELHEALDEVRPAHARHGRKRVHQETAAVAATHSRGAASTRAVSRAALSWLVRPWCMRARKHERKRAVFSVRVPRRRHGTCVRGSAYCSVASFEPCAGGRGAHFSPEPGAMPTSVLHLPSAEAR